MNAETAIHDLHLASRGTRPALARRRPCVLAVDDEPHQLELLQDILGEDFVALGARDGLEALRLAGEILPDLILLDVAMPGLSGFDVCRRLKELDRTRAIPIIFLTGLGEIADEARGLSLGAADYVTKPVNPPSILARVGNQIRLQQAQREIADLARREYETQLRMETQRADDLARSKCEELKLKDEFLSHVSHELRTPLTAIYGFCTLLADGLAGKINPEQKRYLSVVLKNVQHLQALIEDLLQVTVAQAGKLHLQLERVTGISAVQFAEQTLQPVAACKGIRLASHAAKPLPAALADPRHLRQILIVLIDNAIKFTPPGGEVTVSVTSSHRHRNRLLFEVADTGCGIEPGLRDRIFERLFQVSASDRDGRSGLGLGLNIAKDLVERHGGEIWVEDGSTCGSRFFFTIPSAAN